MNSKAHKSNEEEETQQRLSKLSIRDEESRIVNNSKSLNIVDRKNSPATSNGIKSNIKSKMTETHEPNQQSGARNKVLFDVPPQERKRSSSSKPEEAISHIIVSRACEASVASDISALTDGEFFRASEFTTPTPTVSSSSRSKNFRSMARAPEPPTVSAGTSKLTDIQSETTATTTSSSARDESTKNKKKRSVSFCEVQVREYERILEFNPSVTSGPAVGIGWKYFPDEGHYSLENFEESREFSRCNSVDELALPRDTREHLLRSWGYTQREIAGSVRSILRSKNQRKQTVQNLHAASYEEFMEKATRKMKHVLLLPLHTRKKAKKPYAYPTQMHPHKNFESPVLPKTSIIHPSAA